MRQNLEGPTFNRSKLAEAINFVDHAYGEIERGAPIEALVSELERIIGKKIHPFELHSAFGSIRPETFAKQLLTSESDFISDLSLPEMKHLMARLTSVQGDEYQLSYWLECLTKSTHNPRLSDLIYWPGEYFGDGDNTRILSDDEILEIALRDQHAV
jgi:hypothetical protein